MTDKVFRSEPDGPRESCGRCMGDRIQDIMKGWDRESEQHSTSSSLAWVLESQTRKDLIGLGPSGLPVIMEQLRIKPAWWVMVLPEITGCNPVLCEHRGRLEAIVEDWLRWWASLPSSEQ